MTSIAIKIPTQTVFFLFKCFIYTSLCVTSYQFLVEDYVASQLILNDASSWPDVINIFSVSIDTVAWISLLIIFELETSQFGRKWIGGLGKRYLSVISFILYGVIVYALSGYVGKVLMLSSVEKPLEDPCSNTSEYLLVVDMDEYQPLTSTRCQSVDRENLGQLTDTTIVIEPQTYTKVIGLAWASVINSLAWILVVGVIQFDILMKPKRKISKRVILLSRWSKVFLYITLLLVASFWGVVGSFVDFSDAALWLLGFWIIELNIFNVDIDTE